MRYKPIQIGRKFSISAEDNDIPRGRIGLILHRGAFGSGEHETTSSCLELMEDLDIIKGAKVLDLGSGTGILAIAAIKLGAKHALCVDIQPDAVQNAKLNCTLNGVNKSVKHLQGTVASVADHQFDLIFANIYSDILLDIAKAINRKLRPGGGLLLSGILWEYNYDIRHNYEKLGFRIEKNMFLDEFSTVLMQKPREKTKNGSEAKNTSDQA